MVKNKITTKAGLREIEGIVPFFGNVINFGGKSTMKRGVMLMMAGMVLLSYACWPPVNGVAANPISV